MLNDLDSAKLFNPVAFWTDLGLRALDSALASGQQMGDGVDRIARASAAAEVPEPAPAIAPAPRESAGFPTDFGLGLAVHMQRATLDLVTQSWQQWISMFGTLASLGAGRSFNAAERQNPWLNTLREKLVSEADAAEARAGSHGSSSRQGGDGHERRAERSDPEHALASAAPRRRSRAGSAKPKGARASGNSRARRSA